MRERGRVRKGNGGRDGTREEGLSQREMVKMGECETGWEKRRVRKVRIRKDGNREKG